MTRRNMHSRLLFFLALRFFNRSHSNTHLRWLHHRRQKVFALNDGVTLHYDLHGPASSPRKLLLIMGLLADGAAWAAQTEYFETKGFQCVTYNNRGVAGTSTPGFTQILSYNTKRMAQDALQLADHLGWEQFHLVGVSMGGMISLELALLAPQRLRSLTLVVTHAGGLGGIAPLSGVGHMMMSLFSTSEKSRLQAIMRMLYSKATLKDTERAAVLEGHHIKRMATRIPPKLAAVLGHTLAVYRHYVSYPNLLRIRYGRFPTLVMVGSEDQLVRVSNSRMLSRVLGARLIVIQDGAHGLLTECAEPINKQLFEFFEHAEDTTATEEERRVRDARAADANGDEDGGASQDDEEGYELAAQELVTEAEPVVSPFTLEEKAIALACTHSVHCFMHNMTGFVTGFLPAFAFRYIFFDSIALSASPPISRWDQSIRFGLVVGILRGSLRAIRCILHPYRARQCVKQHGLISPIKNNQNDAQQHESASVVPASAPSTASAAAVRKGIPTHAGFEFPYHSFALLAAFALLLWKKQLPGLMLISDSKAIGTEHKQLLLLSTHLLSAY